VLEFEFLHNLNPHVNNEYFQLLINNNTLLFDEVHKKLDNIGTPLHR
jgi:hypothetical protein